MRGFSPPHLLLAASNPLKMIQNLNHLLDAHELAKLTTELDRHVTALFALGEGHFNFATTISNTEWRQKISRLYYAVYNVRRAVVLKNSGGFSTDSSDHRNVDQLPDAVANRQAHIVSLRDLREDRNLADYSHHADASDLVISPNEAMTFATGFLTDCRQFLLLHGLVV